MIYYLYEIKNNINGKIYIGVHETKNINDDYMGSGNLIKKALQKHGKENFTKTILKFFDTKEKMYAKEAEIITEEFIARNDTYNISIGGLGGSMKQNQKPFRQKHSEKTKALLSKNSAFRRITKEKRLEMKVTHWSKTRPEEQKEHARYAGKCRWGKNSNRPIEHLEKTKTKISQTLKKRNLLLKEQGIQHPNIGLIRQKITCPVCKKQGAANVMNRWHFNNCKQISSVDIA